MYARVCVAGTYVLCVPACAEYMFREELGAAEGWLAGMHGAAQENLMSIQYCMALPSDLLASMAYPHVTNCASVQPRPPSHD